MDRFTNSNLRIDALNRYDEVHARFKKEASLYQRVRMGLPREENRNEGEHALHAVALARFRNACREDQNARYELAEALRADQRTPDFDKLISTVRGQTPLDSSTKAAMRLIEEGRIYNELPDQDKLRETLIKLAKEREEVKAQQAQEFEPEIETSEVSEASEADIPIEPEQEVSIIDIPMNLTDTLEDFDTLEE